MRRKRSYQDLTQDEKAVYDKLRSEEKKLPRKSLERAEFQARADAMLGLEPEPDLRIKKEHDPGAKPWRGSSTFHVKGPARLGGEDKS